MAITVRRNFVPLSHADLLSREDMAAVGQLVRQRIIDRIDRGVDASGRPFAPYSDGYAKAKRDALGTGGHVDLRVSGEMLRAITYDAEKDRVTLYFAR